MASMWKEIVENIVDPLVVLDADGKLLFQNKAHRDIFGDHPAKYLGDAFFSQVFASLETGKSFLGVLSVPWKGEVNYLLGHFFPIKGDTAFVFHYKDISDVVIAEQEIVKEHQKYEFLLSNISGVVGILDSKGRISYISPSVKKVSGYATCDVEGKSFFDFIHPADRGDVKRAFESVLEGRKQNIVVECKKRIAEGSYKFFEVSFSHIKPGIVKGFRGVVFGSIDVTDRKMMEYRLYQLIYTDEVTGLPNRKLFEEKLKTAMAIAKRTGRCVAVMVVDVRNMRRICDLYGSSVGDSLLREFGNRLIGMLRVSDIVGRLWSDEFVVALVDLASPYQVERVVERIVKKLRGYYNVSGLSIYVDVWIGVAIFPIDTEEPEELIRKAHLAMTFAKEKREHLRFYSQDVEGLIKKKQVLQNELVRALQKREFVLYFQPIFSAYGSKVVAAEALLRWNHPERGIISPDDFIPLAEEVGLILPIGDVVLEMVVDQMKRWRDKGLNLRVAVNVSQKELHGQNFVSRFDWVLKEVPPELLELEITETAAFEDKEAVSSIVAELKKRGLSISLDDFGTGYSSLEALVNLPVDKFKIDKTFVINMFKDDKSAKVVKTVLQMGEALGVKVVAEGVETKEHFETLKEWGCHEFQGYYFSKPLPAQEFERFVASAGS